MWASTLRCSRSSAVHRPDGFTAVELVLVLVVLGVLVLLIAPRINVARIRTDAAMKGIGTTLLTAQRQAVTRQHDVIVTFDLANRSLHIHEDGNNNGAVDAGERRRAVALEEGVVFGLGGATPRPMGPGPVTYQKLIGGQPALVFHRDGSASEAAGFYLTSARAAASGAHPGDTRAIETEPGTGRVNWFSYTPPTWQRGF